jgi:ligand-binding sensor domain-containing protein
VAGDGMSRSVALFAAIVVVVLGGSCRKAVPQEGDARSSEAHTSTPSPRLPTAQPIAFKSAIRSILHDSRGRYWFGSDREGVARLDDRGFSYFSQAEGLPGAQIRSIQEDARGAIWVGTERGAGRIDGDVVAAFSNDMDARAEPGRWTNRDGDLWFAAGIRPGVLRYDGTTVGYLPLPIGGRDGAFAEPLHQVTALAHGKGGRLWIATYAAVFGYDGDKGVTILDAAALGVPGDVGELHIRSVFEDSRGDLWIGNNGLGVLRFDGHETADFSKEMGLVAPGMVRGGEPSPPGTLEHVFAIEEDRAGNLWFGDRDTGAWRYDGRAMTHYGVAEGLPTPSVWGIHADRDGAVLVALDDGVVRRLVDGAFEPVFGRDAEPSPLAPPAGDGEGDDRDEAGREREP